MVPFERTGPKDDIDTGIPIHCNSGGGRKRITTWEEHLRDYLMILGFMTIG